MRRRPRMRSLEAGLRIAGRVPCAHIVRTSAPTRLPSVRPAAQPGSLAAGKALVAFKERMQATQSATSMHGPSAGPDSSSVLEFRSTLVGRRPSAAACQEGAVPQR